jgi:hypothetical protein
MRWIWVSLPHATYGLAVDGGKVVTAAPIGWWAVGKDEQYVADYLRRRGARLVPLDPREGVAPK